jgi:folate-dependent phosphoribosylglycinamide formyltransferase PurN
MVAGPGEWTDILYQALIAHFAIEAVILEQSPSRFARLRKRARRLGILRVFDQAVFSLLVVPALRVLGRSRLAALRARLGDGQPIPEERIVRVDSINSEAAIAELQRRNPGLVVVSGTRVIAGAVIDSIRAPFVNMHAGITPRYRGVHGAYWALAEGRPGSAGVTVHLVDRGIDTGGILGQALISPSREDSFATYPYLQLEAGLPLLIAALEAALGGRIETIASIDATSSVLRYHPGLTDYVARRLRRGVR